MDAGHPSPRDGLGMLGGDVPPGPYLCGHGFRPRRGSTASHYPLGRPRHRSRPLDAYVHFRNWRHRWCVGHSPGTPTKESRPNHSCLRVCGNVRAVHCALGLGCSDGGVVFPQEPNRTNRCSGLAVESSGVASRWAAADQLKR